MKSFAKLVKNEFIKFFAQTAYKVLLIVMAVLFMLVPILSKGLTSVIDWIGDMYTIDDDIEYYESSIEDAEDDLDEAYYQTALDCLRFFKDNGMDYDSWQYTTMYYDYLDSCLLAQTYYMLQEGTATVEMLEDSLFSSYLLENVGHESYREIYNKFSNEKEEYENLILTSQISDYYNKISDDFKEVSLSYETLVGQLKAESLYSNEGIYKIAIYEEIVEACKQIEKVLAVLIEENADYNDWKYNSFSAIHSVVYELTYFSEPVSSAEFAENSLYRNDYDGYEEYVNDWYEKLNNKADTVALLSYSVLNNVPTQSVQLSSSKSVYTTTLMSNIELIMYFAVVIAGLIVANEFSSGSARLLFIRPHSRNKILLSKYTMVLLLVVALNIVNALASFLFTVLFNGVGDIFVPNLVLNDGVVSETSCIWNVLATIILSNFRLVFIISLAFMMSALCKKGALGIVVGLAGDMLLSAVYSIVCLATDFSVLKFTPLPYYMMEIFATSKVEYMISQVYGANIYASSISTVYYPLAEKLSIWGGLANSAFWYLLCLAAIFIPFRKQEIKN